MKTRKELPPQPGIVGCIAVRAENRKKRVEAKNQTGRTAFERQASIHPQSHLAFFQARAPFAALPPRVNALPSCHTRSEQDQSAPQAQQRRGQRNKIVSGIRTKKQIEN